MEATKNCLYFLVRVITGDEHRVFENDLETKRPNVKWHTSTSSRPNKARISKTKIKRLMICFFDTVISFFETLENTHFHDS